MKRTVWRTRTRDGHTQVLHGDTLAATHSTTSAAVAHVGRALTAAALPAPTVAATGTVWVIPEGQETSDGALVIDVDAIDLTARAEPLPFMWQTVTEPGHDGAVLVGRLTNLRREDGWIVADLEVDDTPEGREAIEDMVNRDGRYGVSADFGVNASEFECIEEDDDGFCMKGLERVTAGELLGATGTMFPYFAEARVELAALGDDAEAEPDEDSEDVEEDATEEAARALVLVASAVEGPALPPASWFDDPQLTGPTHLTVDDDGRIVGHLAAWGTCHIGRGDVCITPPVSAAGYAYYRTGLTHAACDDGCDAGATVAIPTGVLTMGIGHADRALAARAAAAHYDDVTAAVADVAAGEDAHGIWLAGALRPDVTAEQVRALRASDVSGDWRDIGGRLELVAALAVNVAGFPVPRAQGLVRGGRQTSLVAAGIVHAKPSRGDGELERRLAGLERWRTVEHLRRRVHA